MTFSRLHCLKLALTWMYPVFLFQMAPLEQQQQVADRLSQQVDVPQVDLPPEESSINLTQLVPELDLLGDKGKEKKNESDEEEVGSILIFHKQLDGKCICSTCSFFLFYVGLHF